MDIENNTIVVCSKEKKMNILKSLKKLVNIKFFTKKEFLDNLYFTYDSKAILYIIKEYSVKESVAREYLDNLIYVENKNYEDSIMIFLKELKDKLIEHDLLIFNKSFKKILEERRIIIYYNLTKEDEYLLRNINYEIKKENYNDYKPVVYEFDTESEEIEYVAYKISELIKNGVEIKNIKLTNVSEDYYNNLEKIFGFYNLRINKHHKKSIISNLIGRTFAENLNLGCNYALESISKYSNTDTYKKIVELINKYTWCDKSDLKIMLESDLKNTSLDYDRYTNEIEIVDFRTYSFNDEYVFMLGFNEGIIPKNKKDEDLIPDSFKSDWMDKTIDKNRFEYQECVSAIKSIKNLTITYRLKNDFIKFYPSNLIDDMNLEVKRLQLDITNSYSKLNNQLKLSYKLDDLVKFGKHDKELDILSSNYDLVYNTYNNNFKGIEKEKIRRLISAQPKFNLSYSSMDNYNRCAFRFYVEKILKINPELNKFSIILGNIYHHVLELAVKGDIDVKEEVDKYIIENELVLSNGEKFLLNKAINNIEYVIEVIKKQMVYSKLKNVETEKFISIKLKDNINFIGFIDKIVYGTIDNIMYASIIDYKTYVKKPSLKYMDFGIGLQLPSYMLLANSYYKNINFIGFYLQNIILDNKSDEEKLNSLKLIGYTNENKSFIDLFDSSYKNSNVISGLKVTNSDDFSANSKKYLLSNYEIDDIINKTRQKIDEVLENIMNAKFDINPKYDKTNIGCEFCSYRDLCFMNENNFTYIKGGASYE